MNGPDVLKHIGITDAWVDPVLGYANDPELHVSVQSLPNTHSNTFRYRPFKVSENQTLWWALDSRGWVSYMIEDPRAQQGYGGRTFTFQTRDGGLRQVRGPWSSRSGVANFYAPLACVEVIVHPEGDSLAYHGLNLTLGRAAMALKQFAPNWTLFPTYPPQEEAWELRWCPSGRSGDVEESHQDFLDWKRLMGTMKYGPARWLA